MMVGERISLRKKRVERFPLVLRTTLRVNGCVFHNTIQDAAIDEVLKLIAGTSSNHLSQTNVSLRLLDRPGGSPVGPEWVRHSSVPPTSANPLLPAPAAALRYPFTDTSNPAYEAGAGELWVGTGSSAYRFSALSLEGGDISKASGEALDFELDVELASSTPSLLASGLSQMLDLVSGASGQHFSAANVFLRPYSDQATPVPGSDLAATSATVSTALNEIEWLFRVSDGTFEGEWARTVLKLGNAVFRNGPCKGDGGSCGTKTSGEEWDYTIHLVLGRGSVSPGPRINSFTASPTGINLGQTSRLGWATEGGQTATLKEGSKAPYTVPVNGSRTVEPTETTSYTLTVTDAQGRSATRTISVAVDQGPRILTFTATPPSLARGSSSVLAWTSSGGQTATLQTGNGTPKSVPLNGSESVSPTATTSYKLVVHGTGDRSAEETRTIVVGDSQPPRIERFTASQDQVCSGSSITFTWLVTGTYTRLEFRKRTDSSWTVVTGNTHTVTNVTESATYELRAVSPNGSPVEMENIHVLPSAEVTSLTASVNPVCRGFPTTLTWRTRFATAIEYREGDGDWGPADPGGSIQVNPHETTRYSIRASDDCGGTDEQSVVVSVKFKPQATFSVNPRHPIHGTKADITWSSGGIPQTGGGPADGSEYRYREGPEGSPWSSAIALNPAGGGTVESHVLTVSPTCFELHTWNECGAVRITECVFPCRRPDIQNPGVTDPTICSGKSTTYEFTVVSDTEYTWRLSDGQSGTGQATEGRKHTVEVTPTQTTSYGVSVTNECGATLTTPDTVQVYSGAPATTPDITTADLTVAAGTEVTVEWNPLGTDAENPRVRFTGSPAIGNTSLAPGTRSYRFTPTATGVFYVAAENACGAGSEDSVNITVLGPPTISADIKKSTDADSSYTNSVVISSGDDVDIRYSAANHDGVQESVDGGTWSAAGSSPISKTNVTATTRWYYRAYKGSGAARVYSSTVWVEAVVEEGPTIGHFYFKPREIHKGDDATLYWAAEDATGVTIAPDPRGQGPHATPLPTSGSWNFRPQATETYTLTAVNDTASSTARAQITVRPAPCPRIITFTASPATIGTAGTTVTLQWERNSVAPKSIKITNDIDSTVITRTPGPANRIGNVTVTPNVSTAYTLTLEKPTGTSCMDATAIASVSLVTTPVIQSFTADSLQRLRGQTATLRWQTQNATVLRLRSSTDGGTTWGSWETVTGTSKVTDALQETTTFELEAGKGSDTVTAQLTVTVDPKPHLRNFRTNRSSVLPGHPAVLSWDVDGETTTTIDNGVGDVTGQNSVTVRPTTDTTYGITSVNSAGQSGPLYVTVKVGSGGPPTPPPV